jgi:hypothetical protein
MHKKSKQIIMFTIITTIMSSSCITTVHGKPWNQNLKCWEPLQYAGTTDEGSYDDGIVIAKSPDGIYWKFLSPAIPDDFVQNSSEDDPNRPSNSKDC